MNCMQLLNNDSWREELFFSFLGYMIFLGHMIRV